MIGNASAVWLFESLASDSMGLETCVLLVRECCKIPSEDSAEIPWFFESCEGEALRLDGHHLTRGRCRPKCAKVLMQVDNRSSQCGQYISYNERRSRMVT
jgi:hypothetical protein